MQWIHNSHIKKRYSNDQQIDAVVECGTPNPPNTAKENNNIFRLFDHFIFYKQEKLLFKEKTSFQRKIFISKKKLLFKEKTSFQIKGGMMPGDKLISCQTMDWVGLAHSGEEEEEESTKLCKSIKRKYRSNLTLLKTFLQA